MARHLFGGLLLLLAVMSPTTHAADAPPPPGVARLSDADFCPSSSDAIPGPDCAWKRVALAHLWHGPRGGPVVPTAWFRLHWPLASEPDANREMALYLRAMNRVAHLYVNGRLVRTIGTFTAPLPLNWNRAQFVDIPPGLLHAGDNVIDVHQGTESWQYAWLAPVDAGPADVLRPEYASRVFWQNDAVRILCAATAVMSAFLLSVWLSRREEGQYGWLGAATAVWSIIASDFFIPRSPIDGFAWEQFIEMAQVLHSVFLYVFVLRYCGQRVRWLERGMWTWVAAGSAWVAVAAPSDRLVEWWYLGTLVASLYFLPLLLVHAWRRRLAEAVPLTVASVVTVGLSAYDLWLFDQRTWTDRIYLAHFGAPLLLFVMGSILLRRFVESLDAHRALAAVLEQRVADKAEALLEARRNEAVARERARLMSEMHDGIGSQLTLALSLVERERDDGGDQGVSRVASVLRESVDDLQLIIDSLEPVENDLLTVLGNFRYRVQKRLERGHLRLSWEVIDLPPMPVLTPQNVLSILRIVQEAFANCLKHAQATQLALSTSLETGEGGEFAVIRIVDDGQGIAGGRPGGRGLESMRRRAVALGGRLDVESVPGRTEVALHIPTGRQG